MCHQIVEGVKHSCGRQDNLASDRHHILHALSHSASGRIHTLRTFDTGGAGSYGEVICGILDDLKEGEVKVVAKRLRKTEDISLSDILRRTTREADILSSLKHDNIVPFYGIYVNQDLPQGLFLVTRLALLGNALGYLREHRRDASVIISGVLEALLYLHTGFELYDHQSGQQRFTSFGHLDLKPDNILVAPGPKAWLCDFGQAMESVKFGLAATNIGCISYLAPELISHLDGEDMESRRAIHQPADVYAFGLTCFHLMTGVRPIPLQPPAIIVLLFRTMHKPESLLVHLPKHHDNISPALFSLLEKCWSIQPQDRPTMIQFKQEYYALEESSRRVLL